MKYISLYFLKYLFLFISFCLWIYLCFIAFSQDQRNDFPEWENYIALVLDVSQSMNVRDIWGSARIDTAKQYIRELLSEYIWYNFSLNIFAWESQRVLPFTNDAWLIATFLQGLDSNNLTKQGSNIEIAFRDALDSFPDDASGSIVFFTDGDEDDINVSRDTLEALEKRRIDTYIVGIGTLEWWYIPTFDTFNPYKTYLWETVVVWLNREWLKKLSTLIWWRYLENIKEINIESSNKWSSKKTILPSIFLYLFGLCWFMFFWISIYEIYRK